MDILKNIDRKVEGRKNFLRLCIVAALLSVVSSAIFFATSSVAFAGVGYALERVSGFHSYGNDRSVGGFNNGSNRTDSAGGNPAPLACAVNKQKSSRACINAGSSFNKWLNFGVFSVYDPTKKSNGGTRILTFRDGGGGEDDGYRYFWKAPSLTGNIPPGFDRERLFQIGTTKESNGESAKNNSLGGNWLFNGKHWTITKGEMNGAQRGLRNLYGKYSMSSPGNTTITVARGETVRLEWSCQPYQIQYFQSDCGTKRDNCTVGKMLRLFDGAVLSGLPSNNGGVQRKGSRNVEPTGNATYKLQCKSSSTSGSWATGDTVNGKTRYAQGTWSVARQDSPSMNFNIVVVDPPVTTLHAWTAKTSVVANPNTITVDPGERVQLYTSASNSPTSCSGTNFSPVANTWRDIVEPAPGTYKDYTANCSNAIAGAGNTDTVRVIVRDYPTPTVSCSASPSAVKIGTPTTWTANASGGVGTYSYQWEGSETLTGSNATAGKSYSTPGTKTARVRATASGKTSSWMNCSNSVTVTCLDGQYIEDGKCKWSPPIATLEVKNTTQGGAYTESNISILPGDEIDLRWTSQNTNQCRGNGFSTGDRSPNSNTITQGVDVSDRLRALVFL